MYAMKLLNLFYLYYLFHITSGFESFKHLPQEKRHWLHIIAVKQGIHAPQNLQEERLVPHLRAKRDNYQGCSGGGGGGGGAGGGITYLDTVVVTAERLPPSNPWPSLPIGGGRFPSGGGGGGRGDAAPAPNPASPAPNPDQDKNEDPNAKQMTLGKFTEALELLEQAFPNLPPDQMAHKLRMLVSRYDSSVWRVMLNVNINPIPGMDKDVSAFQLTPALQPQFDLLTSMMDHRFQNGAELGVIKIAGDTVAFGHVITGMTAGYDHQSILGMDNLYATTISGDLGHSGLVNDKNPASPLIGPSGTWQNGKYMMSGNGQYGMATRAEVLGDIDGFNLGKRIQANPTLPMSQHFKDYYSNIDSQKRFDIFKGHTSKAELTTQVYRFANLYDYKDAGLLSSVLSNASPDLAVRRAETINRVANKAVNSFCSGFSSELGSWCR